MVKRENYFINETFMFEYIETVMKSQHIGINDNLEANKKAVVERCKKLTI
jgi:hypothetical protein